MPYTITSPDSPGLDIGSWQQHNFDYDYPGGLDLKPGNSQHQTILARVMRYGIESARVISRRHHSWEDIDEKLTAYIPTTEKENEVRNKDRRKPVSIVFPYSYAILETLVSYLVAAFFPEPIFRYEGAAPQDVIGAMLLEKLISLHCNHSKVALNLHTMFRDASAYGFGVVSPQWLVRKGKKEIKLPVNRPDNAGSIVQVGWQRRTTDVTLFEGNTLHNIDPYRYLPDPAMPIHEVQRGEYVGWMDRTNYMDLLSEEQMDDSDLFNVRYLQFVSSKVSSIFGLSTHFNRRTANRYWDISLNRQVSDPVDQLHMYVKLIPKQWKLGTSDVPEKWLFTIAGDAVIIRAKPLGLNHDMFPVAICAPDFDGYSPLAYSRLEILGGMQTVIDWLFNCTSADTEYLTRRGWVRADATLPDDEVATIDPITSTMWFERPIQWFEYDYDGDLIHFKSNRHDILVTPNHNLFGAYRTSYGQLTPWDFVPAALVHDGTGHHEFRMATTAAWHGVPIKPVVFPDPEVTVECNIMAAFLGWLLADGSIVKGQKSDSYLVSIKQSKSANLSIIGAVVSEMGFHVGQYYDPVKNAVQFSITDKRLFEWLEKYCYDGGTTGEYKRVPQYLLDATPDVQKLFLHHLFLGNSHRYQDHTNLVKFGAESRLLADGVQELCIKVGYSCTITDTTTHTGKPFWILNVNENGPDTTSVGGVHRVQYKGKVYCFENSTHLTIMRRNGKPVVIGQSHIANVRKAINDKLIVDPFLLNIKDLESSEPGGLVRLRRPAWGKGLLDNAVKQLGVADITANNMRDVASIIQYMQQVGGTDNPVMGSLRTGGPERLTGAEYRGTAQGAVSRLERIAKIIGVQAMQDIGYMFAHDTQQLMTEATYIKESGDWPDELLQELQIDRGRVKVSPLDILVDYNLIIRDGSIPGGNFSDVWVQLFKIISENQALLQQFDIVRVFEYIATNLGAKNVENFRLRSSQMQSQVVPDQAVQNGVQQGNLVPLQGALNGAA